ncbi:hypothetical protein ERX46_06865 [Brumimicrobium glaciale]|uniref:RND transporter n=1 Tax=Brumimicrobium glaciale TaxID=200475 RepID=A0A4Q4KNR3_9FLAO|nr:hypothetical protein [Brumimicrobium glaciale]RYM35091.1 hypothetical protein ERX46_06865 [Brumimicrobium glaciale]
MNKKKNNNIVLALLASLTLGLAPFTPEPHLFGKLKWVFGGANGMQPMDWFDLLMHGAPWIWLIVEIIRFGLSKKTTPESKSK